MRSRASEKSAQPPASTGEAVLRVERQERRGGGSRPVTGALMREHEADAPPDHLLERRVPAHRDARAPAVRLDLDVRLALLRAAQSVLA